MVIITSEIVKKKCPICGSELECHDTNNSYTEICLTCDHMNHIYKTDYLKDFVCEECNCFEGKIEENDKFLAVRCAHCGKQYIKLEKHTTFSTRTPGAIPMPPEDVKHIQDEWIAKQNAEKSVPKCPKCGCTNIQVVRKKWSLFTGFMTNATERVCAKCNYRW